MDGVEFEDTDALAARETAYAEFGGDAEIKAAWREAALAAALRSLKRACARGVALRDDATLKLETQMALVASLRARWTPCARRERRSIGCALQSYSKA